MTSSNRECIFCGSADGLSREHVLARWIRYVVRVTEGTSGSTWSEAGERYDFSYPLSPLDLVTKAVCKRCNNGWLAKLEGEAAPLLKPMLASPEQVRRLGLADQELLAFWATKTAVTCQYVLPTHRRMASRRFRKALRRDLRLPLGTVVWIGRHDAPGFEVYIHSEPMPLTHLDHLPEANAHGSQASKNFTTTIVIGPLLFHVLVFEGADFQVKDLNTHPKTMCIWPEPVARDWPNTGTLDRVDILEIAGVVPRGFQGSRE